MTNPPQKYEKALQSARCIYISVQRESATIQSGFLLPLQSLCLNGHRDSRSFMLCFVAFHIQP